MGSVFANGGFLIYPHVVAWKQAPNGTKEPIQFPQPVQVLKPETVMTMRQMMQRVITSPHGTARTLHLVGYTLAGKTGTAQIFDFAHHAYTHKYNASFLGFAPVNNPSFLVVVTLSGTTGIAGFGAYSAGPAFQKIANTALRIREVPRDVPEEIEQIEQKELAAKEKLKAHQRPAAETDPVAALSTPPTDDEIRQAMGDEAAGDDALANISKQTDVATAGPKVPDFAGKTVKDTMQSALAMGIDLEMEGDGLARTQYPAAGTPMIPGARVRVRFSR
jgi:membrane peptidoglycan carboxypeptidase